jgi:hypothetical protein
VGGGVQDLYVCPNKITKNHRKSPKITKQNHQKSPKKSPKITCFISNPLVKNHQLTKENHQMLLLKITTHQQKITKRCC